MKYFITISLIVLGCFVLGQILHPDFFHFGKSKAMIAFIKDVPSVNCECPK